MKAPTTRLLAALVLGFAGATAVLAQTPERLCTGPGTAPPDRIAACLTHLETGGADADTLVALARAYREDGQLDQSLVTVDRALALDPNHRMALVGRVLIALDREAWAQAETDLQALIAAHPDYFWGHYRLGRLYVDTRRFAEAPEPLGRAIPLNPDFHWAYVFRAHAYRELGRRVEAGADWGAAARLEPFEPLWHRQAWWDLRGLEPDRAAYHARIYDTLDPNDLLVKGWLNEDYADAPGATALALAPMAWQAPPEGRDIRYLVTRGAEDTRDDVTRAIEELGGLFSSSAYPRPDQAAILDLGFSPVDGARFQPRVGVVATNGADDLTRRPGPRFFTMFPIEPAPPPGGEGPVIEARFDGADPSALWPLSDGATLTGSGRFVVDCSTGIGLRYVMLGCIPDVALVELGQFTWQASVSAEQIHVPLGRFDTYRIGFDLSAEVAMLGQNRETAYRSTHWMAPDLNAWVARRFVAEGEYTYHQALEIIGAAAAPGE